jgi:hypothetical protein
MSEESLSISTLSTVVGCCAMPHPMSFHEVTESETCMGNTIELAYSDYFEGKTQSILLIRSTYYQYGFMYCTLRRGQNEEVMFSMSVY